jgi:ABC-type nitrate/sulfonate/bicarbonate transport system substrate-binding protein
MIRPSIARLALLPAVLLLVGVAPAQAPSEPAVRLAVITFDGGWNVPLWAAQRQGYFDANGIAVQLTYTPSSAFLVGSLVEGRQDIGFALIDNLVAYQEGQAETVPADMPELVAFMGVDGGFLSLASAPGIRSFPELKGKTLSVDGMTTGAAYVLREFLARNGIVQADVKFERAGGTANRYRDLIAGKHDATLLRTPFELLAENRGYHVLATAEALGAYQGTTGIVRRDWARSHETALTAFLRAYRAGLEFVYDPANRGIVEALLVANIRDLTPPLARQAYDRLLAKDGGLTRDLALDPTGIRTVLALRSKYGTPQKALTDVAPYVDSTYLRKAFGP